jgi:hypothetical protein
MARAPSAAGWARAARVAAVALAGAVYAPVGLATHYHTYAVTPAWNRALVMTDVVGAHFFHRWKGYWGTATAFSQRYRGGEPVPGPHTPPSPPAPVGSAAAPAPLALAVPMPSRPVTAPSAIQPAYRDSGTAIAAIKPPPSQDNADDQVLPQWRDSGTPLHP